MVIAKQQTETAQQEANDLRIALEEVHQQSQATWEQQRTELEGRLASLTASLKDEQLALTTQKAQNEILSTRIAELDAAQRDAAANTTDKTVSAPSPVPDPPLELVQAALRIQVACGPSTPRMLKN